MKVLWILALTAFGSASLGGAQDDHLEEHYGYVEVRPGANMFWVMYHVDQPGNHTDYPLIMWLQGGPGASGVGYGNFVELGPYDINGNPREFAWTKKANVMFVDNPVGTGYSYVEKLEQLATDNAMIASDLVEVVKTAFTTYPEMQVMPFYVFAESYGGKMTVDFALEFDKAIKNGELVSDFRGVALGDSWISPMDSVNTWGPFLYQMGFVNAEGENKINEAAAKAQAAVDAGQWEEATNLWGRAEDEVIKYGNGVNFYNVLAKDDVYKLKEDHIKADLSHLSPPLRELYERHVAWQTRDALGDFMNGAQAEHWKIPDHVVWDSQGSYVFGYLSGDFMKPVIGSVVKLLTETNLDVIVFTGNLDLICDTPGTYKWIENMEWPEKPTFMAASNKPITISAYSATAATIQEAGRFYLYTIMRSGHMVPIDAPEMSLEMLDRIFKNKKQVTQQESETKNEENHQEESLNMRPFKLQESETKEQAKHQKSQNEEQVKHQEPETKKHQEKSVTKEEVKHQKSENPEVKIEKTVKLVEEPKQALKEDVKLESKPEPQTKANPKKVNVEEQIKEVVEKAKKEEKIAKDSEEEESKETSQEEKVKKEKPKQQKESKKEKTYNKREIKEQSKKEYKKEKAPKQEYIEKKAFKKEKVSEQEMKKQDSKQKKQDKYRGKEYKSKQYKQDKSKKGEKKNQEYEGKKGKK